MFCPEWHLVAQESSLISSCIYQGLTDIRKANIDIKGLFYTSFYNLAIGIERLLKLTLIIDYIQSNNLNCPSSTRIRRLGHDLIKLLQECQISSNTLGVSCDLSFSSSLTKMEILTFLNEYSKGLRYYNLDTLNGSQGHQDPLSTWNDIVLKIYKNEVSQRIKNKITKEANEIADSWRDSSVIIDYGDLQQKSLNIDDLMFIPRMIEATSPYVVCHLIEIVNEINKLHFFIADLVHQKSFNQGFSSPQIPYVEEFYSLLSKDKKYNLKTKKWIIY